MTGAFFRWTSRRAFRPRDSSTAVGSHGRVAHHLGLDVHDCAQARYESYQGAKITPGMVFTIEPGLYFREDDLMIPPEYRGIGIRIEDDVLMTEDGPEWISAGIPKQIDDVEAWMGADGGHQQLSQSLERSIMPTPDFILELRERIGHMPLWLIGVTGYVRRDDGLVLLEQRTDNGKWTLVTGINERVRSLRTPSHARRRRRRASM